MLTKGFVLIVAALAVVLSVGASWGVASVVAGQNAPGHSADGAAGTDGAAGPAGAAGVDGADGAAGVRGQIGAQGPAGARGLTGLTGPAGAQGVPGTPGASGASAPTFSAISTNGLSFSNGTAYTFPVVTNPVPAGPALVGFSVGLQDTFPIPNNPLTCSLVDANNPTTVFATTAPIVATSFPGYTTYAVTQVVNLSAATNLTAQCVMTPDSGTFFQYQSLSVYAISFAP